MKKIKAAGGLLLGLWGLIAVGAAHAQSPVVIDNGAAQFATVGTWPASTTVPGFEGANYQTHEAQGSPPGAIVVDNTDAGFSVTGTWPTSTAVSGFLGANYQVHAANGEEPTSIVVDNTAGTTVGTWPTSTSVSGFFGTNYQVHAAGTGGDSFTWTPTIPTTGTYLVYTRWTIHPNRSTHALYTVNHAGGATPVTVNQEVNGGQWNLLGTFTLNAGSSHSVVLSIQDDGYVIADAIKVVPQGAAPNTASWTPTVPTAKAYHVYARWTAHPNRATDAKYTVTHAGGETTVTINQELNNGAWVLLGTFNLAPGAGHKVSLTDQANGYVIADAVRLIGTDEPQVNSATWSPNLTGEHQVYAKWTQHANRATNATYAITHAGGSTAVTVNQQLNGGQFNLLGSFTLTAASTITLTDNANGFVIADAIQLVSTAPVALQLYFVHTDHLNTPRLIANAAGQAVWRWENIDPFGGNPPDENPSSLGSFQFNLRFPGQYHDPETAIHQNVAREYDPTIGRYIQSDPIGLDGGVNTYAYAVGNPLGLIDPTGTNPIAILCFTNPAGIIVCTTAAVAGTAWVLSQNASNSGRNKKTTSCDLCSIAGGGSAPTPDPCQIDPSLCPGQTPAPQRIALGKTIGLNQFAGQFNAQTYQSLGWGTNWRTQFMTTLNNQNTQVYVNVPQNYNVANAVQKAARGTGSAFDWELLQLRNNPQWWSRCYFYQNGVQIPNPF